MDIPAGLYRGRVEGAKSGPCEARLLVARIPGGCIAVDYEAIGADGVQHVEHTVVEEGALYVAHSEAPGVQIFRKTHPGVFDGPPAGPYLQRIVISWNGDSLTWAWHWASVGEDLREQSRAVTHLANS